MRAHLTAAALATGIAASALFTAMPAAAAEQAGIFTIRSNMHGKCLAANGENVEVQSCAGGFAGNQLWRWDGRKLRNLDRAKCLDVKHGEINAPVQLVGDCHGNANQRWLFDGALLRTDVNGQVLSIQGNGDPSEHAGINMRNPGVGNLWQQWRTEEA
ncbi:hypothetical protein JOF53_007219 [Crossiella equi]|uniref:Ricin B lectin domain-containing protein n=1 Tax=Crossiella equi TaxID=130796 RepID=A0ABS5APM2_9PSEU|nr:RICIN domain-containing protein [Crossiella equi]MBP2478347.1 hypothetical protein [Crossiella equi]